MSDEQNTEQQEIQFSINGQYIHENGRVVGLFASEEVAANFVGLINNIQSQANALASIGDAMAATLSPDSAEAAAWKSLRVPS